MDEAERDREIAELKNVRQDLAIKFHTLSNELAPSDRRERAIKADLHALDFFRGRRETIQSNRIQSVKCDGDKKSFEYGLEPVRVVIRDEITIDERSHRFQELMLLHEAWGKLREERRICRLDIEAIDRAIERLRKIKIKPPPKPPKPKTDLFS